MFQYAQFTVATLLIAMAFIGAILVRGEWTTLVAIEIVAVLLCGWILTKNLPSAIRKAIKTNCQRLDGSWSSRREAIEMRAVRRVRWSVTIAIFLVLLPTNGLLLVFNSEVLPLSIGLDVLTSFRLDEEEFQQSLRDVKRRHRSRLQKLGYAAAEIEQRQQLLARGWPAIGLGGLAWAVACLLFIKHAYLQSLRELVTSIQIRAKEYELRDMMRAPKRSRPRVQQPAHHH